MSAVYKYPLDVDPRGSWPARVTVDLPTYSRLLRVDIDGERRLCLWAIVNPDLDTEPRHILIAPTGDHRDELGLTDPYIGSFVYDHGPWLNFHAFEALS